MSNDPQDPKYTQARIDWINQHFPEATKDNENNWHSCRCRLHEDKHPSLRMNAETGGVKCLSGKCKWVGLMVEYAEQTGLPTDGIPLFEKKQDGEQPKRKRSKLGPEVAWYTYHDIEGNPILQVVRHDPKDFRQKHMGADGEWKNGRNGIPTFPYRLNKIPLGDSSQPIWVVEGEKDVDNGVTLGLNMTTTPQGADGLSKVDLATLQIFKDRWVVFLPDNDQAGRDYVLQFANKLADIAGTMLILNLPGLPEKGDFTDWLKANNGDALQRLYNLLETEHCVQWRPSMQPRKAIDSTNRELHELSEEALGELLRWNDPVSIMVDRAGQLIRVQQIAGETTVANVSPDALRGYLSESARWTVWRKSTGTVSTFPDTAVATDICQRHNNRFPLLENFVHTPVFDAQLRLVNKPGYDTTAQIYASIENLKVKTIPQKPSAEEVSEAKSILLHELLGDFPFVDDASRAHSLAALLCPFLRQAIPGPLPLHLIESPSVGTGKSLLAKVIAIPATGSVATSMSDPGNDDAEWRKRITSTLLKLPTYVFIDNVGHSLESDILASCLTSDWWEDRILGSNRNVRVPQRACWLATGNNLHLKMDIARRTAPIRIDAKCPAPWKREGFNKTDIQGWALENRAQLAWAALTLIRNWIACGKPKGASQMGSFEGYARTMGGILQAANIPGFLANYEEHFRRADTASEEWEVFVSAWWENAIIGHQGGKWGVQSGAHTVSRLAEFMEDNQLLEGVVPVGKNPSGRRVSLGKKLKTQVDRIFPGGLTIVQTTERNKNGCTEYAVRRVQGVEPVAIAAAPPVREPVAAGSDGIF